MALNLWKPEPKRRSGIVRMPPVVPGLAIHRYTNRELGVRIARKANAPRQEPGIAWARLMASANRPAKDAARESVLALLGVDQFPNLSILTFPASEWRFENALLAVRGEPENKGPARTRIDCLERDEAIYRAACHSIPHCKTSHRSQVRTPHVPPFATACVQTAKIRNFYRCQFEDYAGFTAQFDAAWLDFSGQISAQRLESIRRFWDQQVRSLLVVTLLNLHLSDWMRGRINHHGGIEHLIAATLRDSAIIDVLRYGDRAPMVQVTLRRVPSSSPPSVSPK